MRLLRPVSFFLSLCLHSGVIGLAFFLPRSTPPVDLMAPVIDIGIYTIGKPGAVPTAPVAQRAPTATPAPSSPTAPSTPPPVEPPRPAPPPDTIRPVPVPVKPEPVPVPVPAPEPPKPEPPAPEPPKPDPPAPEPPKPEPPKPEPPKPEPSKPVTPARPARPQPSADDLLAAALDDLRPLVSDPDGTAQGDGPGGSGGDGIGLVGSYMQSLVSRIKPNWKYSGRADRANPTAVVRVKIAGDGTILEAEIAQSSGDVAFDGSVLKAVRDTIRVEPPPTPDLMQVQVPFAYEAISQ